MRSGATYLPTLDGWRAVAITMVLICHGSQSFGAPALRDYFGVPGVDVFFGLSGFLITTLLLKEEAKTGSISLQGFYTRRVFRIIPAALLYLSVIWAIKVDGLLQIDAGRWLSSLFFMANYSTAPQSWYTGHFWSLAVEEHFYLIWPATLVLVRSNRMRLIVALSAIAAIDSWRIIDFKFHLIMSGAPYLWTHRTDITADGILFGVAFALAFVDEAIGPRLKSFLRRSWVAPAAIAVFAATCILPLHVGWKVQFALVSLRSAVVPVMILGTLQNADGWLGQILDCRSLRFVGLISYSLYLWQELFLTLEPNPKLAAVQWFPLNMVLAFICAALSYYFLEAPLIGLGRKFIASSPLRLSIAQP